jgi:hypothetical protein
MALLSLWLNIVIASRSEQLSALPNKIFPHRSLQALSPLLTPTQALAGPVVVVVVPVAAVVVADLVVALVLAVDALVVAVVATLGKLALVVMLVKRVVVAMLAKPALVAMLAKPALVVMPHVQTRVQNHVLPGQPIIALVLNLLNPNQARHANPIAVVNLDPPQSSPFCMESGRFWWYFTRQRWSASCTTRLARLA